MIPSPLPSHFRIDEIDFNNHNLMGIFSLFDLLPKVYFYIKDTQGRFLWMNESLRNLLGIQDREGYLGKTDLDYFCNFTFRSDRG